MNKTKIKQLRQQHHLTQEALAEKSYLTVRTIQRAESGEDLSLDSLTAIANVFNVSISSLFENIAKKEDENKIMDSSKEQISQLRQRKIEETTWKLMLVGTSFFILMLTGYLIGQQNEKVQPILGIGWISLCLFTIAISFYLYRKFAIHYLDMKYPRTIGFYFNQKKDEPIKNGWDFIAKKYWLIFPVGGFLSWIIPNIVHHLS